MVDVLQFGLLASVRLTCRLPMGMGMFCSPWKSNDQGQPHLWGPKFGVLYIRV